MSHIFYFDVKSFEEVLRAEEDRLRGWKHGIGNSNTGPEINRPSVLRILTPSGGLASVVRGLCEGCTGVVQGS